MLIMMRGWSGSGKSHYVQKCLEVYPESVVFSTDHFWNVDGIYTFEPSRLSEAHAWNVERVRSFLEKHAKVVRGLERHIIVDNTNILLAHMMPYRDIATWYSVPACQCIPPTATNILADWIKRDNKQQAINTLLSCWQRSRHFMPFYQIVKWMETFEIDDSMPYVTDFPFTFE